jgi:glycerol-3-phosphate acyltransferase PlsY
MKLVELLAFSYLLGSIPFGFLVGLIRGVDIRKVGSGNIGATNVLRALGKGPALIVLITDTLKGFLPVLVAKHLGFSDYIVVLAGLLAILGHSFPVWLKFKGGRGVATGLGVLIGLAPIVALIAFLVWIIIVGITRYVSVASTLAAISVPILLISFHQSVAYISFAVLLALLIILRHIPNYKRLYNKTEPKIGKNPRR